MNKKDKIEMLIKAAFELSNENGGKHHDIIFDEKEMKEAIIFGKYTDALIFLTNRLHAGLSINNFDDIFKAKYPENQEIIARQEHLKYDDKIELSKEIIKRSGLRC
jgi:hypothetical protein